MIETPCIGHPIYNYLVLVLNVNLVGQNRRDSTLLPAVNYVETRLLHKSKRKSSIR